MATESYINLTEGSGKKAHTVSRTIGSDDVHDDIVIRGEHYLSSWSVHHAMSVATTADHIIQIMAGSSKNVVIKRIYMHQVGASTAANAVTIYGIRLTTAGTGGTSLTPATYDENDTLGLTANSITTSKGTEGTTVLRAVVPLVAAQPSGYDNSWTWEARDDMKGIVIPAGTANGFCLKVATGIATSPTMSVMIEGVERDFS